MYEYSAYVKSVYDGDTITVDIDLGFRVILHDQKIRLLGIDAPEVRGEERPEGLKARDFLRNMIEGHRVTLRTTRDKKGKYGRWLATVWLGTKDVNEEMILAGHAVPIA